MNIYNKKGNDLVDFHQATELIHSTVKIHIHTQIFTYTRD